MPKSGPKSESREERLAKALRANLRRRKAQERARDEDPANDAEPASGADKDKSSS